MATTYFVIEWNTGSQPCPTILFSGNKTACINHMNANNLSADYGDELVKSGHDFTKYSYTNNAAIATISQQIIN